MGIIAKFNPYQMDADDVRSLAVGRAWILENLIKTIEENAKHLEQTNIFF